MILKSKDADRSQSIRAKAGTQQEKDVAFYLCRAFKDDKQVFVLNDYKFTFNGETAQIDHLIVYPFGFVLVESKSIKGEVKVNSALEWTRSYGNKWTGMPSPIQQVELQKKLLKELLSDNCEQILEKKLGVQGRFGGRCWDVFCAISSDAIIDRESIPLSITGQLVKSEFLVDSIIKKMNIKSSLMKIIKFADTRPAFSTNELSSINDFLLSQIKSHSSHDIESPEDVVEVPQSKQSTQNNNQVIKINCKHCGESERFVYKSGRYGYFKQCGNCEKNTPLSIACIHCSSKKTKVSKRQDSYTLICTDCDNTTMVM